MWAVAAADLALLLTVCSGLHPLAVMDVALPLLVCGVLVVPFAMLGFAALALAANLWCLMRTCRGRSSGSLGVMVTGLCGGAGLYLLGSPWWWVAIPLDPFPWLMLSIPATAARARKGAG